MNTEGTRQDLATRLVTREVFCCVSTLMSGIAEISQHVPYNVWRDAFCEDQDETMNLFQRPDYEEAARQFVMDDADIDQLEEIADDHGEWSEARNGAGVPEVFELADEGDEDEDPRFGFLGAAESFDDEDDAQEAAIESVLPAIRQKVWDLVGDYQELCQKYDLEPDYLEVYEHWVVSNWLQRKLAERGQLTGEFAGLTIWGRCTTGQSMSLDGVIREITAELWPEEWEGVPA